MKKEDIRRKVRAGKSLLSDTEKLSASESVFNRLEQMAAFMVADRILMYHSLPDELPTSRFINRWEGKKSFFLPRVNGLNLEILPYDRSRLSLGAFQIEEPTGNDVHNVGEIEMIIVPAVAYDRFGNRVGRGKGYYDRLLAQTKAVKVGVAFDCQLVDEIDTDPHDIPVDIVITESHTYIIHHNH